MVVIVPASIAALLASTLAFAAPIDKRQTTCGSQYYSASAIQKALDAGYRRYTSGMPAGAYPHRYNDYEGFELDAQGPWQEWPILASGKIYTGGSPGADRVIFNDEGYYAGTITHHGAKGNNFVSCSGTTASNLVIRSIRSAY